MSTVWVGYGWRMGGGCRLELWRAHLKYLRGGVYFMWGINLNFNYHYFLINLFTFGGPSGREIRCGK